MMISTTTANPVAQLADTAISSTAWPVSSYEWIGKAELVTGVAGRLSLGYTRMQALTMAAMLTDDDDALAMIKLSMEEALIALLVEAMETTGLTAKRQPLTEHQGNILVLAAEMLRIAIKAE